MSFLFTLIGRILKNKFYPPTNPTHLKFTGKTVIVTGSNTGLGYEAALKFATQGCARLILAVRNVAAGEKAQRVIQHLASDPECRVEVWGLEMSNFDSIWSFQERVDLECERVDIAVLNAGVWRSEFNVDRYEREETVLVNSLATVLLAMGLRDVMIRKWRTWKEKLRYDDDDDDDSSKSLRKERDEEKPVLELVSSGRYARPDLVTPEQVESDDFSVLDAYNKADGYSGGKQYAASKLFLMCALIEMAPETRPSQPSTSTLDSNSSQEDLSHPPVHITAVCPGACQSSLSRDLDSLGIRIARFYANMLFLRTTEEGARTLVSGTALGEEGHGRFWQNDEIKPFAPVLVGENGEKFRRKVWFELLAALKRDAGPKFDQLSGPLYAHKFVKL